ncbi:hypothetical protein Droror1_Dr00027477 [Drosera rotundifolia]
MKESLAFLVRDLLIMVCSLNGSESRSNVITFIVDAERVSICFIIEHWIVQRLNGCGFVMGKMEVRSWKLLRLWRE